MNREIFTRDELSMLMSNQHSHNISIYMPASRTNSQQNLIRFKNLIRKAEENWRERGPKDLSMEEVFKPARRLLEETRFWSFQDEGLAVFLSPGFFSAYRLPISFNELVVMSNRFHVKLLLPLLSKEMAFYVLALSQKNIRLLQCTYQQTRQITAESLPKNIEAVIQYDEPLEQLQQHTETQNQRPDGSGRPAMYFGQGVGKDDVKKNLARFFQQVDTGVRDAVDRKGIPLVIVGLEHMTGLYREANHYPHLLDEEIHTNADELNDRQLQQQAWEVVEPYFLRKRQEVEDRYHQMSERELASGDIKEIVPAAFDGRVDSLFVAVRVQQWGSFDPQSRKVDLHQREENGDGDLLDFAAIYTLMKGGAVYTCPREEVPGNTLAAALFRY